MVERRRKKRRSGAGSDSAVNWYFMRPCTGVQGICPPLCTWSQLSDGSLSLADVERFNQAITEMVDDYKHRKSLH